jgi:2-isopropylmalate synthase
MEVRKRFEGILGIRAHDDSDLALANTLEAVEQGFTPVEGSINAYGARRGLANLCSIISAVERKLAHTTIGPDKL